MLSQATLEGAHIAYAHLLYQFTKHPLTIEDAYYLIFLATPIPDTDTSITLDGGQPSAGDFFKCAKLSQPLSIPDEAFEYIPNITSTSVLINHWGDLCTYAKVLINTLPRYTTRLSKQSTLHTPTIDTALDYPSLLSLGIQEGFTWVKDEHILPSLVSGAVIQRSVENAFISKNTTELTSLPWCEVDYNDIVEHANAHGSKWIKDLFFKHSCVVVRFAGDINRHFNYKSAYSVLTGFHWYAFLNPSFNLHDYYVENGAPRYARTHVILLSPTEPFRGMLLDRSKTFASFFKETNIHATPRNLLNMRTYNCAPIHNDITITTTCAGLPTWFSQILNTLRQL